MGGTRCIFWATQPLQLLYCNSQGGERINGTMTIDEQLKVMCEQDVAQSLKPKQYNFARHWKSKIVPLLDDPGVVSALTLGLKLYDIDFDEGEFARLGLTPTLHEKDFGELKRKAPRGP
jgi:hypothetical protein